MEQNKELRTAWEFVENTGRSIFLTGKAGTGKTTFLRTVVERSRKRSVVVAPTGVAAINAGGVTIHSFFQLPLSPFVPNAQIKSKFDFGREKRKIMASLDLLIIDEISMVRSDLLDAIDSVLRRFRNHYQPFGGVQLLMIGDLQQLTPVVTPEDEKLLKPYYDTPYFFGSKALAQIDYVTIQLEKVYRQEDTSFLDILNHIRIGQPTAEDLARLNARCQPLFTPKAEEGYIRLTTHNNLANFYNESELQKLPGRQFLFHAQIEGTFPEFSYPVASTLVLKLGAQVMFVKNDPSGNHLYYNGRIGQVTYVDDHQVLVLCPGDEKAIKVEPLSWENARYTLDPVSREIKTEVQGTFTQLPLRLAWAITIHKSQGLTFDHAIIDANQSFAPGQVYVALSRCRSLEGLVLAANITPRAIINDERVDSYIGHQEEAAAHSIEQLPTLKEEYYRYLLLELFDFSSITGSYEQLIRLFSEYFLRSHPSLMQLHNKTYMDLKQRVSDVANKWTARIRQMSVAQLHEEAFLERVGNSASYFADNLEVLLEKPLLLSAEVNTNNKQAMQRLGNVLPEVRQAWLARRYLLTKISDEGYSITSYLREKQMSMLDALDENVLKKRKREQKPKVPKEVKPRTWEVSYGLYLQGMKPADIAKERSLTMSTIVGHLARYVPSGKVPLDDLVTPAHQQSIRKVIRMVGTDEATLAIKSLCPPDVSYDEVRLMQEVMKGLATPTRPLASQ